MSERKPLEDKLAEELGFRVSKVWETTQAPVVIAQYLDGGQDYLGHKIPLKLWQKCLSLLEREAQAREIVEDIAKRRYDDVNECDLCYSEWNGYNEEHADSCPYRRAVEFLEQDRETKR